MHFKARTLKRGPLERVLPPEKALASKGHFTATIGCFLLFSAVSFSGSMLIDVESNGQFDFLFGKLFLPVLVLALAGTWLAGRIWHFKARLFKRLAWAAVITVLVLFTGGGVLNYANALLSKGQLVDFRGPIRNLDWHSGKGGSTYTLVLVDEATQKPRKFHISVQEYRRLKPGDAYSRTMEQGGLGYAYRWR